MPSRFDQDPDEPPVVDINALHRREWRRLDLERRRRAARHRILGAAAGAVLAGGLAYGAYAWVGGEDGGGSQPAQGQRAPVRVDVGPPPAEPPVEEAPRSAGTRSGSPTGSGGSGRRAGAPSAAGAGAAAAGVEAAAVPSGRRPIVWVQAGHADPREPGYRAQTGAGSGPFGSEIGFTTNLAPKVVARLRRAGIDARRIAGRIEPNGASGAAFVSLHHDVPGGAAAFGHAITGAGENYYHGEGVGTPSPTPYADSAPHRAATTVSAAVERRSRDLADRIAARYRPIYTAVNGARGRYGGVQTRAGNPRMMRYYGFYRTRADARVIVEAGAGATDDAFLARTDLIAEAVSRGVLDHLRARGLVRRDP